MSSSTSDARSIAIHRSYCEQMASSGETCFGFDDFLGYIMQGDIYDCWYCGIPCEGRDLPLDEILASLGMTVDDLHYLYDTYHDGAAQYYLTRGLISEPC